MRKRLTVGGFVSMTAGEQAEILESLNPETRNLLVAMARLSGMIEQAVETINTDLLANNAAANAAQAVADTMEDLNAELRRVGSLDP